MSFLAVPAFEIGATAQNLNTIIVERGGDVFVELTVTLPDIDAPVISGSIVDVAYLQIRTTRTASSTTYDTDSEPGGDLDLSRPDPNTLVLLWHLPYEDSELLELAQSPATLVSGALRTNFPSQGLADILVETSDGYRHYICEFEVSAKLMVTRVA